MRKILYLTLISFFFGSCLATRQAQKKEGLQLLTQFMICSFNPDQFSSTDVDIDRRSITSKRLLDGIPSVVLRMHLTKQTNLCSNRIWPYVVIALWRTVLSKDIKSSKN